MTFIYYTQPFKTTQSFFSSLASGSGSEEEEEEEEDESSSQSEGEEEEGEEESASGSARSEHSAGKTVRLYPNTL